MASLFEDMLNAYTKGVTKVNEWVGAPLEPVRQTANNVNAGILSAIPSAPAVFDLARAGVSAGVDSFDRLPDQSYIDALSENFSNEVLPPEGRANLEKLLAEKTEQFVKTNPTATESDQQKFIDEYTKSDEYMKATYDNMSWGLGTAMKAQWAANEIAGVDKRPDELSAAESGAQIIGQSVLGLTSGTVKGIADATTKVVGKKVANSAITKIGARVVEAVTPLTLPLNPTNVAVNSGVGIGIDNAIRYATSEPTLFESMAQAKNATTATEVAENEVPYDPNTAAPSPEHTTDASIGIAGAAALLFGGRFSGAAGKLIAQNADDAFIEAVSTATKKAPTLAEQSGELKPLINSETSDLLDSTQPVTDVMKKLGASNSDIADLDAVVNAATSTNRSVHINNAFNLGKLMNVPDTIAYREIEQVVNKLPEADQELLHNAVYATMRKQDTALQTSSLEREVMDAQNAYTQAVATGNRRMIRSAEKTLTEKMQARTLNLADDPSVRPNMEQWTNEDVDNILALASRNPAVKQTMEAMQKVSGDIANYRYVNGDISQAMKDKWMKDRPLYIPLAEQDYAGLSGFEKGKAMISNTFNDFMNGGKNGSGRHKAARDVSGENAKVNQPRSVLDGLQEMYYSAVNDVTMNTARRDTIDRMRSLGGEGRAFRKVGPTDKIEGKPHVTVRRDGKEERYVLADTALARALDFAPLSTVPILHQSRKLAQSFTTGIYAPWFAPKAFAWDNIVAPVLLPKGRSLGLVDTLARRLASGTSAESAVGRIADTLPDPTSLLTSVAAIPYSMGMKTAHAAGQLVARDLLGNNKFLQTLAQADPRVAKLVEAAGDQMAMAFDRSVYNVFHQNISGHTYGNEAAFNNLVKVDKRLQKLGKVGGTLLKPYKAIMESIHEATRLSFFYQNYGLLDLKYKGNIPADEMRKLVRDTKGLTADLSRASGKMRIQQTTSAIPYANATIQGSRYMMKAMVGPNASKFWSRMGAIGLPIIGAYSFMDSWEGASDYWNNKVPAWQRVTGIPMPKLSVLAEAQQTGKMPEFTPDKLDILPMPPEISMVMEPVLTGLRTMGLLGGNESIGLGGPMQQLGQAMKQVTSFTMPPAVEAGLSYFGLTSRYGGIQPVNDQTGGAGVGMDMMAPDSEIPNTLYNVISSFFGTAANIGVQTFNAFDIAMDKEKNFTDAVSDAFDVGLQEVKSRLPSVSVPGIWDAQRRYSAATPEADYTYKTLDVLEPIIGSSRQISVERDSDGNLQALADQGYATPDKISNPILKQLSEVVYTQLKQKGTFKGYSDAYTDTRRQMQALDRMRVPANQSNWLKQRNALVMKQQDIRSQQAKYLQKLENTLAAQAGPIFEQQFGMPFSYANLTKLVYKDVQSQR